MQKGVFLFVFFVVWWFCFSLCVLFSLFGEKKSPTRLVSCNFRVFFFLCPQEACLQNPSFLPILFSFLVFPLSSLSKLHFFFAFCPSAPFWKTLVFLVSLSFFFLPFPFLMFACFFRTNVPNIPFLKPKLLSCLVVSLFLQLFLFLIYMFHRFCLSVLMLALFLVCLILFLSCFCFVLVLLSQTMKNIVFLQF